MPAGKILGCILEGYIGFALFEQHPVVSETDDVPDVELTTLTCTSTSLRQSTAMLKEQRAYLQGFFARLICKEVYLQGLFARLICKAYLQG